MQIQRHERASHRNREGSPLTAPVHVAVVGGGLSGLTAAFYLQRLAPSIQITLLESKSRLGGVIQTERIDDYLLEQGPDMFSTQPRDAFQLCEDLGIVDQLIEPCEKGRGAMIVRDGRCYSVPDGFVLMRPTRVAAMLRTPLLSAAGKLRLLTEPMIRRRCLSDDESVASFVRRRLGTEVLNRIVQPLVGGIYTADAEQLSMQATMPQFVKMEQKHGSLWAATRARKETGEDTCERTSSGARYGQFRSFPEGMGRLDEALRQALSNKTVRCGAHVERLENAGSPKQWRIHLQENSTPIDTDGVILAVPTYVAGSLLSEQTASLAKSLKAIPYASSVVVAMGVRNADIARPVNTFGIVVPHGENRKILACSFSSVKFPNRSPAESRLLRVFMGGALQPELCNRTESELLDIACQELSDLIGLRGTPELSRVIRWNRAMPQYHLGHRERAQQIESDVEQLPGLELAGNGLHGVGISPVIATARKAAERLISSLATLSEK